MSNSEFDEAVLNNENEMEIVVLTTKRDSVTKLPAARDKNKMLEESEVTITRDTLLPSCLKPSTRTRCSRSSM